MRRSNFPWLLLPLPAVAALFVSCASDSGVIAPDDEGNQVPLVEFCGKAYYSRPPDLNTLKSLHIVLTWQFFGYTKYTATHDVASIKAGFPFNFSGKLIQPPPAEVYESDEPALGKFWMYCDYNGNGAFDRIIHPALSARDETINLWKQRHASAVAALLSLSTVSSLRVEDTDTFFVGQNGMLMHPLPDTSVCLWPGHPEYPESWRDIILCRTEELAQWDTWEYFFMARKRATVYRLEIDTLASSQFRVRVFFLRSLFPKTGKEREFEDALGTATYMSAMGKLEMFSAYQDALKNNWLNYPFIQEPGQDFAIGGSKDYYVLFLPNQSTVDRIRIAEAGSSFIVSGKERIHTGFNLLKCDDQYRCQVCSWKDSILIALDTTWDYFDPPSAPAIKPCTSFATVKPVPPGFLSGYEGVYLLQVMRYLTLISRPPHVWAAMDGRGMFRLTPYDSTRFFSPVDTSVQIEATVDSNGAISKILYYEGRNRYVALPKSDPARLAQVRAAIDAHCAQTRVAVNPSRLDSLAADYDWNGAVMRVAALGESLSVTIPGFVPQPFFPAGASAFFSDRCDRALTFTANEQGSVTGAVVSWTGVRRTVPRLDYAPRSAADITGSAATGFAAIISEHQGSGRDVWISLNGKPRYIGGQYCGDSLFLAAGDGCVHALRQARPSDAISLHDGGDLIVFRLPDRDTASFLSLEVIVVTDSASSGKRARLAAAGGRNPDSLADLLCDDFWITLSQNGTAVVIDPIKTPAGGYYVALELTATMDQERYCAFDSYRIGGQ